MVELQPGDFFASNNPQGVGKLINWRQRLSSLDRHAIYGHTGFINDAAGTTTECVWSVCHQNLFEAYAGQRVIVCRWHGMTQEAYARGFEAIRPLIGRTYPYHRLILHLLGLARWIHLLPVPVCSETTDKFGDAASAPTPTGPFDYWGVTPDNLVDFWVIHREYSTVAEGMVDKDRRDIRPLS